MFVFAQVSSMKISQQLQSHHTPRRKPSAAVNLKQPCIKSVREGAAKVNLILLSGYGP
jgi:hypothetical protein